MGIAKYVPKRFKHFVGLRTRFDDLEQRVRFLLVENIRLNQVIRELIYLNDLKRTATGSQTKESFDYQWREVGEGEWMPSNKAFLETTPDILIERTGLPREWFPGKKVLDAGCGSGRWSYGFAKLGADLTSVDQSAGALEKTRELVSPVGKIETRQVDLLKFSMPDTFDLVWCFGVAHHTENLMRAMTNVMQAVKPGGWLFMMLYGFPNRTEEFAEQALYEEWRRKLAPLPMAEKVELIRQSFPPEQVHGYFDAFSPLINDLVTWEWIQVFLKENGFVDARRTLQHVNHYFVARRKP